MLSRNQELKTLEEEITAIDDQIKSHCIAWAQEDNSSLDGDDIPGEVTDLNSRISSLDNRIGSMRELILEEEECRSSLKDIQKSETEENRSLSDFYQILGKRAFDLYKKGALKDSEELDAIFAPLMEYEDRIRNADNELYRIRSGEEEARFWSKLGSMIKRSSQNSRKKSAGEALVKQYRKCGQNLIDLGHFNEIAQNGLSDIYDEFQDKEAAGKKRREDSDDLNKRIKEIEEELSGLSDGVRAAKGLRNLEEEQEAAEKELDAVFLRRGQELYGARKKGAYLNLMDDLNAEREAKTKKKTVLMTENRLAELDASLEKKGKELEQQMEKVGREQEKLDALGDEKTSMEATKDQFTLELENLRKELGEEKE